MRCASVTLLLHRTPTSRAAVSWDSNFCEAVSEWIPELSCEPPFFPSDPETLLLTVYIHPDNPRFKKKEKKRSGAKCTYMQNESSLKGFPCNIGSDVHKVLRNTG